MGRIFESDTIAGGLFTDNSNDGLEITSGFPPLPPRGPAIWAAWCRPNTTLGAGSIRRLIETNGGAGYLSYSRIAGPVNTIRFQLSHSTGTSVSVAADDWCVLNEVGFYACAVADLGGAHRLYRAFPEQRVPTETPTYASQTTNSNSLSQFTQVEIPGRIGVTDSAFPGDVWCSGIFHFPYQPTLADVTALRHTDPREWEHLPNTVMAKCFDRPQAVTDSYITFAGGRRLIATRTNWETGKPMRLSDFGILTDPYEVFHAIAAAGGNTSHYYNWRRRVA